MLDASRIRDLPLFAGLNPESLHALAQRAREQRYTAGDILFRAGEPSWCMYVVLEGRVRVLRGSSGRNVVVHTEGAGGTLADVPFFAGGVLPATAIASEPTTCAILPRDAVRAAIEASPDVAFALLERLAVRIRDLVDRIDQISSNRVASRLATYMLRRCDERSSTIISLGMTQGALAEELGTVREVIVRELRAFRQASLIRPARSGWIEVIDTEGLRTVVGR